ncbi:MAG: hypothetical protein KJ914_10185 [Gammaproteobacteria bacterium]|nr:hypothetical protein [Gammaproteobacteria bacterium]MBU1725880.1 hypothetical protein [Gammaproteobacteria bacterium]MBU2006004.1 hypothetical protein [Gammaproteobacteria bacterium]
MRLMFDHSVLLSLVTLLAVATPAMADMDNAPQRSLLVSVGVAQQSIGTINSDLLGKGYSNITLNDDKQTNSIAVGYRHPLDDHWSIDTHYLDQDKAKPQLQATLPTGKTNAQAAQEIAELHPDRGQGLSVVALHHHPLGTATLQSGIGAFAWHSEHDVTVGSTTHTTKNEGLSPLVQLGLGYPLTHNVRLEGNIQHFFMPDEAVDRVTVGLAIGL